MKVCCRCGESKPREMFPRNSALGFFQDDLALLEAAVVYLRAGPVE